MEIYYNQHILQAEGPVGISKQPQSYPLEWCMRESTCIVVKMRARDPANRRKTETADSWPVCPFLKLEAACISWERHQYLQFRRWIWRKRHLPHRLCCLRLKDDWSPTLLTAIVGMLEACRKVTTETGVTGDRRRPNRPKYTTSSKKPAMGNKRRLQLWLNNRQKESKENLIVKTLESSLDIWIQLSTSWILLHTRHQTPAPI